MAARCRPYGGFCLCHLDVALRPMKNIPNLRLLGLSLTSCAYHAFFAECLPWPCVNRLQLCLAWSVLYSLMVHPLFSFATLLTPRTPLNREGALVLRLRSRRIPSKLGLYNYIRLYTNIRGIVPRHAKYNIHQLYTQYCRIICQYYTWYNCTGRISNFGVMTISYQCRQTSHGTWQFDPGTALGEGFSSRISVPT